MPWAAVPRAGMDRSIFSGTLLLFLSCSGLDSSLPESSSALMGGGTGFPHSFHCSCAEQAEFAFKKQSSNGLGVFQAWVEFKPLF